MFVAQSDQQRHVFQEQTTKHYEQEDLDNDDLGSHALSHFE
ncbi:hypothetical protein VMA_002519 [Vibrio mimicus VM223]|nr:hypothetical protein VMA_002519 [Vibrio mimicus VM223]